MQEGNVSEMRPECSWNIPGFFMYFFVDSQAQHHVIRESVRAILVQAWSQDHFVAFFCKLCINVHSVSRISIALTTFQRSFTLISEFRLLIQKFWLQSEILDNCGGQRPRSEIASIFQFILTFGLFEKVWANRGPGSIWQQNQPPRSAPQLMAKITICFKTVKVASKAGSANGNISGASAVIVIATIK